MDNSHMIKKESPAGEACTPERRKYPRIESNDTVVFQRHEIPPPERLKKIKVALKNISAGGLLFESREKYNVWDVLKLKLRLSKWSKCRPVFSDREAPYRTKPPVSLATVVRVKHIFNGLFDIGVCFKDMDDEIWLTLLNYVDKRTSPVRKPHNPAVSNGTRR